MTHNIDLKNLIKGWKELEDKYFIVCDNKPYHFNTALGFSTYSRAKTHLVNNVCRYIRNQQYKTNPYITWNESRIKAKEIVDDLLEENIFEIKQLLK
jgi:hypothetical protein